MHWETDPMGSDKSSADTVEMPLAKALSRPLGPDTGSARVQVDIAAQTQGMMRQEEAQIARWVARPDLRGA